jgi:hypothetical protein
MTMTLDLEAHGLTKDYGFLPVEPPLETKLPDYYSSWERVFVGNGWQSNPDLFRQQIEQVSVID